MNDPRMIRFLGLLCCLVPSTCLRALQDAPAPISHFSDDVSRQHELKPFRHTFRLAGVRGGFNQLHLTLIVSPEGDVTEVKADGDQRSLQFWPQLKGAVAQWKYAPFEKNGIAVTAEVEEDVDLVPPERLPEKHVAPPILKPNSKVTITLQRTGCYGSCSAYTVSVTTEGIAFDGKGDVVAPGKHTASLDPNETRQLAKAFLTGDFYSMDASYRASVTDNPTYLLSISIDGHAKQVEDYVGSWEGMPAIVSDLEEDVDSLARSDRWRDGSDGLVEALKAEKFDFKTYAAQLILKGAASRGQTTTVQDLLEAGVPLKMLRNPVLNSAQIQNPLETLGWLTAASRHPEALQLLIDRAASKDDQRDKDLALAGAAGSGITASAAALIAYGADPNADLSKLNVTLGSSIRVSGPGAGSILIYAAESGNPEMVGAILHFHPQLEVRDREGKTAIFAVGQANYQADETSLVECIRLLAQAGADVNARDNDGNTPLHELYETGVIRELLSHGANVNARNGQGETPIFTTVNNEAIAIFIRHGADLTIRNHAGKTVMEEAKDKGPERQAALEKAIQSSRRR